MMLTIESANGSIVIKAQPYWTVGYLKLKASERIAKMDSMRTMALYDLVKEGNVLKNNETLHSNGVQEGDTLVFERKHNTVVHI